MFTNSRIAIAAAAVSTLAFGAFPAFADSPPLRLAKTGWLYAGGKIDPAVSGSPMVGQMYVEYMIPEKQTHPFPVIMIHGGNQTGTNFTGTVDGREGWAQYFARRGFAVYVVDTVARGRSANWSNALGKMQDSRIDFVEQRFVAPERAQQWPQAKLHTQFPGAGQPGDPYFDRFYASQAPSLADFTLQQQVNREAGAALLDSIGPAILLTHSQGGAIGWAIADARPNLVKAIVAIEPSGPPVRNVDFKNAPEWYTESTSERISGIADVPLAYDPPLQAGEKLKFVSQDKPEGENLVACWKQAEPARKLASFVNTPVQVVMSNASYHAPYDHCTVAYLKQAGVPVTFTRLADLGITGNNHMMMMEKNSDDIAAVIVKWVTETERRLTKTAK